MSNSEYRQIEFVVAVTGHAEEACVPTIVRKATESLSSFVLVRQVRRVHQRPRSRIVRRGSTKAQVLPDHVTLAREVPKLVHDNNVFFLWIDDLEGGTDRPAARQHFDYYAQLLDKACHTPLRAKCSIHFLVNMLEAYFLADTSSANIVLGTNLTNHAGDCEDIKNPKGVLESAVKKLDPSAKYDVKEDGGSIAKQLNLETILSSPDRCRALRTLVAWCWEAIGEPRDERFQLASGQYWDVTAAQLQQVPDAAQVKPLGVETGYLPETSLPA